MTLENLDKYLLDTSLKPQSPDIKKMKKQYEPLECFTEDKKLMQNVDLDERVTRRPSGDIQIHS